MTDPIITKAVALKKLADELKSPKVDEAMAEIMKIINGAVQHDPKAKKQ